MFTKDIVNFQLISSNIIIRALNTRISFVTFL